MRHILATVVIAAAAATLPSPAAAIQRATYSDAAFVAAQNAGRPILIEVHAPWCPVCAAQNRMIEKVTSASDTDLIVFRIDFDTQKTLWKKFRVQKQSTIIAFRGRRETARISYVSDEASITRLVASTRA